MLEEIFTATFTLFAIIDILGAIPIIIPLRKKMGHIKSTRITIISGLIMFLFLFFGEQFLALFGISIPAFSLVGALIILFIGAEMVFGVELFKSPPDESKEDNSIIPIAFPLVAGAGTLTTILSMKSLYASMPDIGVFGYGNIVLSAAILLNLIFVWLVLKSTRRIEKLLGVGGLAILRRVFGIILLGISINIGITNLTKIGQAIKNDVPIEQVK